MNSHHRYSGVLLGTAIALTAATGGGALAQSATRTPDPSEDRVVVTGESLREQARNFVGEIAEPAPGAGLARWQRRVCVGVMNAQEDKAQYIVDRVSEIALTIGLNPGDPGCDPDITIMFTTDGPGFAQYLVETERRNLRIGSGAGFNQGVEALETFASNEDPVRWWYVSIPTDPGSGRRAASLPIDCGALINPAIVPDCVVAVAGNGASRIHRFTRDDMADAIVIVDVSRFTGVTFRQAADYIAMVSLAQIAPDGSTANFDTILNLFDDPAAAPRGITQWDFAYLQALYDAELDTVRQSPDVVFNMVQLMEQASAEN